MAKGIITNVKDNFYKYRFYLLLFALILNFFIPPLTVFPFVDLFFRVITTAILIFSGVNFIQKGKHRLRKSWFLFGLFNILIAFLVELFPSNHFLEISRYTCLIIFFMVITINLLQQIFSIKFVTVDVIIGSFCGYILIGINSFFLFALIDFSIPDSFSGLSPEFTHRIAQLFYFTFTCMTTVGFGDILPINMFSQKFAMLTASIGQFYIAVVVAILVSRFMNRPDANPPQTDI